MESFEFTAYRPLTFPNLCASCAQPATQSIPLTCVWGGRAGILIPLPIPFLPVPIFLPIGAKSGRVLTIQLPVCDTHAKAHQRFKAPFNRLFNLLLPIVLVSPFILITLGAYFSTSGITRSVFFLSLLPWFLIPVVGFFHNRSGEAFIKTTRRGGKLYCRSSTFIEELNKL
jgi:hypothetical protein